MRTTWIAILFVLGAAALVAAQASRGTARGSTARAATKMVNEVECAATLGTGIKSSRGFCDVLVATTPSASVSMTIPAHTGTASLQFDLHNRFSVPVTAGPAVLAFARHEAMVAVIRGTGERIDSAIVVREFRTVTDLFDQIGGGTRPGGVKAVAPGPPEAIRMTIPAGVSTIGIVGTRLKVLTRATGVETFETPGRPVAIVSNMRLDYTPAR